MPSQARWAEFDRRWRSVVHGRLAWALFGIGILLFGAAAASPPATSSVAALCLPLWFASFVLWFASSFVFGGLVAAVRRDVFTAVVMGSWGLVLTVLGIAIALSAIRR
jgi:hypothetical protein